MRLSLTLSHRASLRLLTERGNLDGFARALAALNPRAVLSRGYTMTTLKNGTLVKRSSDVRRGDVLITQTGDGNVESVARDPKQPELF